MTNSKAVWAGEASNYDQTRPTPPPVLMDILTQLIHTDRPALVVDVRRGWLVTIEFSDAFAVPTVHIDKGRKKT